MSAHINELHISVRTVAEAAIWNVRESNRNYQAFSFAEMIEKIAPLLCDRATLLYKENAYFRNRLKGAKDCRTILLMDMQSWCIDLLKNNAPAFVRVQKPMLRYVSNI